MNKFISVSYIARFNSKSHKKIVLHLMVGNDNISKIATNLVYFDCTNRVRTVLKNLN